MSKVFIGFVITVATLHIKALNPDGRPIAPEGRSLPPGILQVDTDNLTVLTILTILNAMADISAKHHNVSRKFEGSSETNG
jgi:hypothetical protein